MSRADSTHHHGPLAGLGAGAAAVLVGGGLILAAARRQLGEVATVVAWALMAAVILAVIAAAVYVVLWLRHRVLHPEVLARPPSIRAEVTAAEPAPRPGAASVPLPYAEPAALEPGREVHLHLNVTPDQLAAIMRHHTEEN
ncbi:MAG: hypothetical protein ACLPKE_31865 [Streptosporangiaceae bacterium]